MATPCLDLKQADGPVASAVNCQFRIIINDSSFRSLVIEIVALVKEVRRFAQYYESMCKAAGNKQLGI
jgi:hypothetical protein